MEQIILNVTQKRYGAQPEIGRGGPRGKYLRPIDIWVSPVVGNALVEGFCYGIILFMGLVDLNQILINTKITNWFSRLKIHLSLYAKKRNFALRFISKCMV